MCRIYFHFPSLIKLTSSKACCCITLVSELPSLWFLIQAGPLHLLPRQTPGPAHSRPKNGTDHTTLAWSSEYPELQQTLVREGIFFKKKALFISSKEMVINSSFKQYKDAVGVKQITSIPGVIPGLLWPNCPQLLDPHVYTLPSCNRNTECCPPQTISFRPLPVNTLQFLGSNMGFLSTPMPNCPSFAFPQHSMLTNGEGMSTEL